jgi:TonB-linked SusC/RagA family outer membrane protein
MKKKHIHQIIKKGIMFAFFIMLLHKAAFSNSLHFDEDILITGQVVDARQTPLPGVSVQVKGTTIATATDKNGKYSIRVPNTQSVLIFTYIGFEIQEIEVGNQRKIDVTLIEKIADLNDIVVIGYGTQKRSDLTGSISSIKADELTKAKSVSFQEAMQGKVAGVQIVSSSGEPGSGVNVSIRGANSINAGTAPLYVIDGIQIDINNSEVPSFSSVANPLTSINPSDIESIEVLKDASATAIFGSRGANGVIIITTKTGKGSPVLELDTYFGVSNANKRMNLLNGQEYANYRYALNSYDLSYGEDTTGDGKADKPKIFPKEEWHDWQDEVLRPGFSQNYNISYRGGTAKTSYSSSAGYFSQEGILDKNRYERFSLNLKIDHNASNKFKIGTTFNGSYVINKGVASSNGGQGVAYNGVLQMLLMYKPINVPESGLSTIDPDNMGLSNPHDFVNFSYKQTPLTRVMTNLYAEYKILPVLILRVSGGAALTNSENGEFYPSTTSWGYTRNGLAVLRTSNTINWFQTHTLTYTKRFHKVHYLNAMVGFEANSYIQKTFRVRGEGFDIQSVNAIDNLSQAKVLTEVPTTDKGKWNRMSEFGRINYNYKNKYFLTATLRRDGSSKFGSGNKYAWFPSAALAWTVSKEPFFKASFINNLKIRASYGVTGNDRIPAYQSLARATNVYYSSTQNAELGIAVTSMANPNLKWETTKQYDVGLEVEFVKSRINLMADVYKKETTDMLLLADIASQSGFSKQWQNLGRVDNQGLELTLITRNIARKNFSWTTNFNISFNDNEVKSLGSVSFLSIRVNDQINEVGRLIVGEPIGTGYGYIFDGVYQTNDFVDPTAGTLKDGVPKRSGIAVKPGDYKFKDLNGDGIVDNINDKTIISNSNPSHFGGFTNSFNYKGIELSILFTWSYGNEILYTGKYRFQGYFNSNLSRDYWYNRWTPDNSSNYPALGATGRYESSTYYVEDGSYLRLKNITLGYNLPIGLTKKLKINNCRIYITGENLVTWTDYSGFDPEIAFPNNLLPGLDITSYPRSRTFTFGLNIKF